MKIFNVIREEWKAINLGEGFINDTRLEVSNHGRVKTYNKVNNGKLIKGSMINGYPIVRIRLFKPREEKMLLELQQLQSAYLSNQKKIREIRQELKHNPDDVSLGHELESETALLEQNKKKYDRKFKADLKARTTYFAALVHRMVAENFIKSDSPEKTVVAHLDHDKLNNRIDNLCWMTPAENSTHQQLSPHVIADKEKRKTNVLNEGGRSKLSITKVMFLKKLLNEGKTTHSLAKQFKITETQVIRIKREENWGSVEAAK